MLILYQRCAMTYTVEFEPIGIRLICEEPLTVFEAARQAGVSLHSICGGKATCGKCAVRVVQGALPAPMDTEPAIPNLKQDYGGEREISSPSAINWKRASQSSKTM